MRLSINGRFLLQDVTGVQSVGIEFLRSVDSLLTDGAFPNLEVTVWIPRRGVLISDQRFEAITLRRAGRLSGHLWDQLELPFLARGTALLCLVNIAPVARLLFRRFPTYTMVHDLSHEYFPSAYSRGFRIFYSIVVPIVLARSKHVFTVSESEKFSILERHSRTIGDDRLAAVQNGGGEEKQAPPRGAISSVPGAASRSRMALYVGSLTKRKNADGLIRAAIALTESEDAEFVIVGATGPTFEHSPLARSHDLDPRIRFTGQINDQERIRELYREAMVFVFPSLYEASPLPPIEAMRSGCPVVCSDIPSLRERCGDAALYCDPNDFTSIAGQAARLLNDRKLWEDYQQRGLAQSAKFSWKRQAQQVLNLITADER